MQIEQNIMRINISAYTATYDQDMLNAKLWAPIPLECVNTNFAQSRHIGMEDFCDEESWSNNTKVSWGLFSFSVR